MADITVEINALNIEASVASTDITVEMSGVIMGLSVSETAYLDDDAAITGGLSAGALYPLAENNKYTLPQGLIKKIGS